jgi:hypothetical protein
MPEKTLPSARHEPTDVGASFISIGVPLVVGIAFALALLVFWIFPSALLQPIMRPPYPQFPAPRLQSNPRTDRAGFRKQKLHQLNSTGWIDKAHGIVHIPIADAMRKIAQEGIPGWPTPQVKQP